MTGPFPRGDMAPMDEESVITRAHAAVIAENARLRLQLAEIIIGLVDMEARMVSGEWVDYTTRVNELIARAEKEGIR